jgi:oligoendopeptidase F
MNAPEAWDLSAFYPGARSPEYLADLERAAKETRRFAVEYRGRLEGLDAASLGRAIAAYETVVERWAKVTTFIDLCGAADRADEGITAQRRLAHEEAAKARQQLGFFPQWLAAAATLRGWQFVPCAELDRYRPWLERLAALQAHLAPAQSKALMSARWLEARHAALRRYETALERTALRIDERRLTVAQAFALLSAPRADERAAAARALKQGLAPLADPVARLLEQLVVQKRLEDQARNLLRPDEEYRKVDGIDLDLADDIVRAVRASWPRVSQAYYRAKASALGRTSLPFADHAAPAWGAAPQFSWEQARQVVTSAWSAVLPDSPDAIARLFDARRISARRRPGDRSPAFTQPTVPGLDPYISLGFGGSFRDVLTLAHEVGHGLHYLHSARRGFLQARPPTAIAELVAALGEILAAQEILRGLSGGARRAAAAETVELLLDRILRYAAIYGVERAIHAVEGGALTASRLDRLWSSVQAQLVGAVTASATGEEHLWMCCAHLFKAPFYSWNYVFGYGHALALIESGACRRGGFQQAFRDLLEAGAIRPSRELLARLGVDLAGGGFAGAAGFVERMISDLDTSRASNEERLAHLA